MHTSCGSHQIASLIPSIVKNQNDSFPRRVDLSDFSDQFDYRPSVDIGGVDDRNHFLRNSIQGPQNIQTLASTWSPLQKCVEMTRGLPKRLPTRNGLHQRNIPQPARPLLPLRSESFLIDCLSVLFCDCEPNHIERPPREIMGVNYAWIKILLHLINSPEQSGIKNSPQRLRERRGRREFNIRVRDRSSVITHSFYPFF